MVFNFLKSAYLNLKTFVRTTKKSHPAFELLLALFLVGPVVLLAGIGLLHTGLWAFIAGVDAVFNLALLLTAVALSFAVITVPQPIHALLSLIGIFICTVLFCISIQAEYIGMVLLIVYVGAIAILFLFVVMLLNVKALLSTVALIKTVAQHIAIVVGFLLYCHCLSLLTAGFCDLLSSATDALKRLEGNSVDALFEYVNGGAHDILNFSSLYTQDAPLFLIIMVILLVAMTGSIVTATMASELLAPRANCIAPGNMLALLGAAVVMNLAGKALGISDDIAELAVFGFVCQVTTPAVTAKGIFIFLIFSVGKPASFSLSSVS
jgi:NADH-quinone oxidoreductase subunit J